MKETSDAVYYLDVVEEALCFGWIDGIKKKISETQLAQRLSPRTKKSSWTELNKERVRRLERLGLMTSSGRKVLPDINSSSFVIDSFIEEKIMEDSQIKENYHNMPELYTRIRIDNIQSVRKDVELYHKRLEKFLLNTKNNKMYGQWNDKGRLIE
jgi:uncharacterized protein YdeI (YjbR/CyaY-like superfamily)